jgi:hypothetical protein
MSKKASLGQIKKDLDQTEKQHTKVKVKAIDGASSPPRGERSDFLKVTITLPVETLSKLKVLGMKRKSEGKRDSDVSCLIREALKPFLEKE